MNNRYEILGEVTLIYINKNGGGETFTKVDTADLEKIKQFPNTWSAYYDKKTKSYYVRSAMSGKTIQLHRYLCDNPPGLVIDHKNHDTLDNRKSNLNPVTSKQNSQNLRGAAKNSKSGVRGVSWNKNSKKWLVYWTINNKRTYFGGFDRLEDAKIRADEVRKNIYYSPNDKVV